jgi:hypothetical protein
MNHRSRRQSGRTAGWPVYLGAAAGVGTWFYDYDFFLNAAGPETPISDAILHATRTAGAAPLVIVFWPAVALVLLGMLCGFFASWLIAQR